MRRELRDRLNRLLRKLGSKQETTMTDADLVAMIAQLDQRIDARLGVSRQSQ